MPPPVVPDTALPLSELQEAAIERIHFFQKELRKLGLYARTGIELEFGVRDQDGNVVATRFPVFDPAQYFKNQGVSYVSKHQQEGAIVGINSGQPRTLPGMDPDGKDCGPVINFDKQEPDFRTLQEIVIGEEGERFLHSPTQYQPVAIAGTADYLRRRGLADMLRDTTMLSQMEIHPAYVKQNQKFSPDFTPHRTHYIPGKTVSVSDTIGLHTNLSLYDSNGNNLFAQNEKLMEGCLQSLLKIQKSSIMAHAPNSESYSRFSYNGFTVPKGIGADDSYDVIMDRNKRFFNSAAVRTDYENINDYHIENRLAAGDADPYVVMALSMAALYDAASQHLRAKSIIARSPRQDEEQIATIDRTLFFRPPGPRPEGEPLPQSFADTIPRFRNSTELQGLLGKRLFRAIDREYGHKSAAI